MMATQTAMQNGKTAVGVDPVHEALVQLIQMSGQTNQHLQALTGEIQVMNRQLFGGGVRSGAAAMPASPPAATSTAPAVVPDNQHAAWNVEIIKSRCSQIGITKTLSMTQKWKLNFYVDGEGRPASAYGRRRGEFASLIQRVRGVFPEISPDHFSEESWTQRNKEFLGQGNQGSYEELFFAPEPFWVEWYEKPGTDAQGRARTWAYVQRVYPIE